MRRVRRSQAAAGSHLKAELQRRQFVINQAPEREGWRTLALSHSLFLHVHPDLCLSVLNDKDGTPWHLLGTAVPARLETLPAQDIASTPTAGVWAVSDGWAGRFVLIGDGAVGLDAAGTLGLFYNPRTREASSSPGLITTGPVTHEINHADLLNWYPPPASRFEGVHRLLPSQRLQLAGFEAAHRPLLVPLPTRTYEETLRELEAVLKRTVREMARLGRAIIPLTGGYDSRLILSLLVASGQQPSTYTLEHDAGMRTADRVLPPRIAAALGVPHVFVRRPSRVIHQDARALYAEQSAGHAVEEDQHYLAYGQLEHIADGHVVLHGGGFEVGRQFYFKWLPAVPVSGQRYTHFEPIPPAARAALQVYDEWESRYPEALDWRDRLYWEQRLGGWISACVLATDMLPGVRLAPANCRYTMSLLLSLPALVRAGSIHHSDLIARLTPRLARFPFNPRDPLPRRVLRRLRRIATTRFAMRS